MNNRLVTLLKAEGLTNSKFASILGIQRSNITHIIDGRNKPSITFIEKLINKFPHVNIEWLITGTGEMYKQSEISGPKTEQKDERKTGQKTDRKKAVPPTLFPEIAAPQTENQSKDNQTVSQNVEQEIKETARVTKPEAITETKEEIKIEVIRDPEAKPETEKEIPSPRNSGGNEGYESEQEIECVLIFRSDKTFKYYRPV
jgi:transcriptional regulator with XRE-family HTH domain